MEDLGVEKSVVGLVIPTGYSFNLDGTAIYLTMAAVFIAQATNTPLDLAQQLTLLAVLLLTSKGAAGVTGSGFIVLAATLSAVGHVPVAGRRAHPRHRPVHVRGALAHQPDRQRRRDRGDRQVVPAAGRGEAARAARRHMTSLFEPLTFPRGPAMKNRFMLAPLTNCQSHGDGTLSDEEFRWLTMRAEGGFGLTMTCASHVQAHGRGFPGQLGIFSDATSGPGATRRRDQAHGQPRHGPVHHAGMRSPAALIGVTARLPFRRRRNGSAGARPAEVERVDEDFITRPCAPSVAASTAWNCTGRTATCWRSS